MADACSAAGIPLTLLISFYSIIFGSIIGLSGALMLRSRHRAGLAYFLATGNGPILNRRVELTALRSDGTEFPVELTVTVPIAEAKLRFPFLPRRKDLPESLTGFMQQRRILEAAAVRVDQPADERAARRDPLIPPPRTAGYGSDRSPEDVSFGSMPGDSQRRRPIIGCTSTLTRCRMPPIWATP